VVAGQHGLRSAGGSHPRGKHRHQRFRCRAGLAGGAAINVSIKSGSNDFHGSAWGYDTNSRFRSRTFFQAANQPKNPKNILAQFGYSLSGPVILPHFGEGGPKIWSGKNKLFFFTDLERTTQRNAAGGTFTVAPASLRPDANGNVNFTGTGITVYDPASNPNPALRTPFLIIRFREIGLILQRQKS
jgi:hypothetical protein